MVFPTDGEGDEMNRELERINRKLAQEMAVYNQRPDPEMGGLSPDQVFRLIHTRWGEPDDALLFEEKIPLSLLTTSQYFRDMRGLLLGVVRHDGIKATAKKNLPRSFVAEQMEAPGDEEEKEKVRSYNKVINEQDYFPLHVARVVCQVGGALRLYKGSFVVPQKQRKLLRDERAGALYGFLFRAFFTRFNLAYLTPFGPELRSVQKCAGYTLYRLGKAAREWRSTEELYPEVFLPAVRQEIERSRSDWSYSSPASDAAHRLIRPLIAWGVLEGRNTEGKIWSLGSVRVTPLYDAFFRFHV